MDSSVEQYSPFTELPFGLPGRVFRSRMPFDARDPNGDLFDRYLAESIRVVIILAEDDETRESTGRNLCTYYVDHGVEVVPLPIPDCGVPSLDALDGAVLTALECAQSGNNIVVHCHAGVGRTGLFLACLAQRVLNMNAKDAVHWVRGYIPGALETPEQIELAIIYGERVC